MSKQSMSLRPDSPRQPLRSLGFYLFPYGTIGALWAIVALFGHG